MSNTNTCVVSGMRPTGKLHLGHYHCVLKNWLKLQYEHECFFSIVDLHALTTHYNETDKISDNVWQMAIDWLATGINPSSAHIFIQSLVPEVVELQSILAMVTPLGWLERVPTYQDQIKNLKDRDLQTYGFLGYALLMTADVLSCQATLVPVGKDQVPHLELAREIARRFNHLYGRKEDHSQKAVDAILKLGKKNATLYRKLMSKYQQLGDHDALLTGKALIDSIQHISLNEKELLSGYLEGRGKIILPEPQPLLVESPIFPGLDGRKMSKSYHNTIKLGEKASVINQQIRQMPTDPARVRRGDPGEPEKCPVWAFHKIYSDEETKKWVQQGCRQASIGCLDCKKPLIDTIAFEQQQFAEKAKPFAENPDLVKHIIMEGCEATRCKAHETLVEVREAIGIDYTDKNTLLTESLN